MTVAKHCVTLPLSNAYTWNVQEVNQKTMVSGVGSTMLYKTVINQISDVMTLWWQTKICFAQSQHTTEFLRQHWDDAPELILQAKLCHMVISQDQAMNRNIYGKLLYSKEAFNSKKNINNSSEISLIGASMVKWIKAPLLTLMVRGSIPKLVNSLNEFSNIY